MPVTFTKNTYATAKPLDPMFTVGRQLRVVQAQIALTGTSNGDVVILAEGLPATARIVRVMLPKGCAQISGVSDVDLGFYASKTNKVIDADAVADGITFAASGGLANVDLVGTNISNFPVVKDIATLCGLSSQEIPAHGFDLCATLNTKGSATATIELDIYIEQD
jgi:hypothetical protein